VHLVGFTTEIYHDARSCKRQIYKQLYIVYQTNRVEMSKHVASTVKRDCLVISCVDRVKKNTYDSF
jgi:hypothetical protein